MLHSYELRQRTPHTDLNAEPEVLLGLIRKSQTVIQENTTGDSRTNLWSCIVNDYLREAEKDLIRFKVCENRLDALAEQLILEIPKLKETGVTALVDVDKTLINGDGDKLPLAARVHFLHLPISQALRAEKKELLDQYPTTARHQVVKVLRAFEKEGIPFEILTKRDFEEEDTLTRIQLRDLVGLENPIIHYTDGRPKIPYVQKNISQSLEPFIFIDDAPTQEHLSYRWEASFYGSEKVDPTIKVYKVPQKDWIFGSAL